MTTPRTRMKHAPCVLRLVHFWWLPSYHPSYHPGAALLPLLLLPADTNSLSVLRSARLLRVFKLARSWPELNRIISTILKSFSQVLCLSLLLVLFLFVFALMVRSG